MNVWRQKVDVFMLRVHRETDIVPWISHVVTEIKALSRKGRKLSGPSFSESITGRKKKGNNTKCPSCLKDPVVIHSENPSQGARLWGFNRSNGN